jgi:hypothetical protein
VLTRPAGFQSLKPIVGRRAEVAQIGRGIEHVEFAQRGGSDRLKRRDRLALVQGLGSLVPEPPDHESLYNASHYISNGMTLYSAGMRHDQGHKSVR